MPWCPKCKNEYREGIKICSDCGTELVDKLEESDMEIVALVDTEEYAKKYTSYLEYSKIESEISYIEEKEAYAISVHKKDWKVARQEFEGFHKVESARADAKFAVQLDAMKERIEALGDGTYFDKKEAGEFDTDPEAESSALTEEEREKLLQQAKELEEYHSAGVYTKKADEAKELSSSAITFFVFGVLLLGFAVLNMVDVIHLFHNNTFTLIIFLALALVFCIIGLSSLKRSKSAASEVAGEEEFISKLNEWMEQNINVMTDSDAPQDLDGDGNIDTSEKNYAQSMEIQYLNRTAAMKKAVTEHFGELDDTFLDAIIDEFYDKHFSE